MRDINPNVTIDRYDVALSSENALDILSGYDYVVDGTDNFPTRYLVNDACVLLKKPNVYGSIFRFEGQATIFGYPGGPCYRCLYPEPPPPGLVPSSTPPSAHDGTRPGGGGRRRARRAARNRGLDPGHGNHKADPRCGRTAGRAAPAFRRPSDAFSRIEAEEEPRLPHVRQSQDDYKTHRL